MPDVDVVTGAFGYTGRYITGRLLESGRSVKTVTGHPNRPHPFGDRIDVAPFEYFRGKARVEEMIRDSGLGYAIVRPTVIFGREDILINNIAYILRRLPVFGIPGSGSYRLRPVSVEDVAEICVRSGLGDTDEVIDAVGPETFTFEELVRLIAGAIGRHRVFVHVPPAAALTAAAAIGRVVGDVVVTRDELEGLMAGLVSTEGPATGATALTEWLAQNAAVIGTRYASEVSRHYRSPARATAPDDG